MSPSGAPVPDGELPLEAYLAALAALGDVGPARLRWLAGRGGPARAWGLVRAGRLPAAPSRLGIDAPLTSGWERQAADLDPAELWRRCQALGVGVVSLGSPGYPPALARDPDAPAVLFHLGDPSVLRRPRVAVVGTRRCSAYGAQVARRLGRDLAAAGVCVVSGLALGVDAAAHLGSLEALEADAGAAPGVAVVAAGLDTPGPARNAGLARRLPDRGAVLSEVPPGVPAVPWRFPVRNRILAALADVVVVVESAGAGGSFHTVREAESRDRTVMAVPGPVTSRASEGTNRLIADGAQVCTGAGDVLLALGWSSAAVVEEDRRPPPVGPAAAVLQRLEWRPCTVEALCAATGLALRDLSAAIGELERTGWVERRGGWIERVA